jgi:hypothetical protein
MASTGTPGSGSGSGSGGGPRPGPGPANVYASTAPPLAPPGHPSITPRHRTRPTPQLLWDGLRGLYRQATTGGSGAGGSGAGGSGAGGSGAGGSGAGGSGAGGSGAGGSGAGGSGAGGSGAASGTTPATRSTASRWLAQQVSGTPSRLRLAGVVALVLGLALGAAGFSALQAKADALGQARRNADQLVTVQTAYTALTEADSQATNQFLVGGLENAVARQVYLNRLDLAGRSLSRASEGAQDPTGRAELATAHADLTRYAGLVEAARANTRQGYPIGVAYLRQASSLLRSSTLPALARVQSREEAAVGSALGTGRGGLLGVTGGLVLILLGALQLWLFRTTRRILNLPLVAATVLAVALLAAATLTLTAAQARTDDVRSHAYAEVLAVARTRVNAFDAKSNESLTLISRGSGAAYEKVAAQKIAAARLTAAEASRIDGRHAHLVGLLSDWAAEHQDLRRLDDAGFWDEAVERATRAADDPRWGPNGAFEAFNQASRTALDDATAQLDAGLTDSVGPPRTAALPLLLLGLLVAAAAWAGVTARLREFR